MCASETQRDLWLGAMLALRLIGPGLYDRDPTLRTVIDLVPFGVPEQPPQACRRPAARADAIRSLERRQRDRAVERGDLELARRPDCDPGGRRLVHAPPHGAPGVHGRRREHPASAHATEAARSLAGELGLLGSIVHFHDRWVPYAERGCLAASRPTARSPRTPITWRRALPIGTRLLDCFWAGLPVVCTSGDDLV